MALLWADGFDHYGLDETKMLDGVYAQVDYTGNHATLSSSIVNTGTGSMYFDNGSEGSAFGMRKVLPSAVSKMGACGRFYFPDLPSNNVSAVIFDFMTAAANTSQVSVVVDANGCLRFFRGKVYSTSGFDTEGTQIAISDPIVVASAWNHIEVQVYIHATLGWVRVAINGVHRFAASALNTLATADNIVSVAQRVSRINGSAGSCDFYMDDYYLYDFTGVAATDTDFCPTVDGSGVGTNYIGELQVMYLPPNGDTAETDWVRSAGSNDYECVDELTPNDADYITSTTAGDLSEFELTDLPEDITYIRGLVLLGRMSKSDAGAALIKYGMKSVAATADSAAFPVTTTPTYWWTFQNTDPNSSSRWTRASLNAAWYRLTRDS